MPVGLTSTAIQHVDRAGRGQAQGGPIELASNRRRVKTGGNGEAMRLLRTGNSTGTPASLRCVAWHRLLLVTTALEAAISTTSSAVTNTASLLGIWRYRPSDANHLPRHTAWNHSHSIVVEQKNTGIDGQ